MNEQENIEVNENTKDTDIKSKSEEQVSIEPEMIEEAEILKNFRYDTIVELTNIETKILN